MIKISAPLPPTINHYYKLAKGRKYITQDGQSYREVIGWLMRAEGCHPEFPRFINERLKVHIELFQSDRRHWDIDNRCKSLLDALQHGGAYKNDSQIDVLLVERKQAKTSECIVTIEEIND